MHKDGRAAHRATRQAMRAAADDSEALAALLDPVAMEAAAGSTESLELLVWAVDELDLARPSIRRILVEEDDVEEAAQDALIAVAETIHRFRGDARFTTWLYQVARFKAIALLRRRRESTRLPEDETAGDVQRISSMIATRASIGEVLRALPAEYRDPILLRDVEHLPYDQIAARLDLNINTARARVARGRALVAARLRAGDGRGP